MKLTQFELFDEGGIPCLNCHHDLSEHFEPEGEDELNADWDYGCIVEGCRCEAFV